MLLTAGSISLDTIISPDGARHECIGGSAVHFATAAALFCPVRVTGIVGEDFPPEALAALEERSIDTAGIARVPGKTFRWSGRYFHDMDRRETLATELNVFGAWQPRVPDAWKDSRVVFLANGAPRIQLAVLDQVPGAELVFCDTMDLWISTARDDLTTLLGRVHGLMINESEALMFTGDHSLLRAGRQLAALGPRIVVIKKGAHGVLIFSAAGVIALPAYPTGDVRDPTGAGDSFAGAFLGCLASGAGRDAAAITRAAAHAVCAASFNVEDFGIRRLAGLDRADLDARVACYRRMLAIP